MSANDTDLSPGGTALRGKSHQVFAYFSPNGLAHFVDQPSTYYLPRLKFLRNIIIQHIAEGSSDTAKFKEVLTELRDNQYISPILHEEVAAAVSLDQLSTVVLVQHGSSDHACSQVVSMFEKPIRDLENCRIEYYDEADFEVHPLPGLQPHMPSYEYDVALSFAGENRPFVEEVARYLKEHRTKVFYDRFEEINLWGKNLYDYLRSIYRDRARFTVIFASKAYSAKMWTSHERESAQERALLESQEYILPARFDETQIPGLANTIAYVDLSRKTPMEFAVMIIEKLRHFQKHEAQIIRQREDEPI